MSAPAHAPTSLLVNLIRLGNALTVALSHSASASILVFESRPAAKITLELADEIVELTGVLVDGRVGIAQRLQHQTICFHQFFAEVRISFHLFAHRLGNVDPTLQTIG